VAGAVALACVLIAVLAYAVRLTGTSDGATVNLGEWPWSPDGLRVQMVDGRAALRPGDEVVAVAGLPVGAVAPLGTRDLDPRAGDVLRYSVRRDGELRAVDVPLAGLPAGRLTAQAGGVALVLLLLAVGVWVFVRRPEDPAAQVAVVVVTLLLWSGSSWLLGLEVAGLVAHGDFWWYVAGQVAYTAMWGGILHFALVFPHPWPLLARRPWLVWAAWTGPFVLQAARLAFVLPGAGPLEALWALGSPSALVPLVYPPLVFAAFVAAARRRPDVETRRRIAWIAVPLGGGILAYLALWVAPAALTGAPLLPWPLHAVVFLPTPIALGAAILRGEAFEPTVLVRRTLAYAALTAAVVALYSALVAVLGQLLEQRLSFVTSLVATGIVAVLFQPLRERLQRLVDRLLPGRRDDPYLVVSRLTRRLEATTDPAQVLPVVAETVAQELGLPYAAIESGLDGQAQPVAVHGQPVGPLTRLPLVQQGEPKGALVLGPRVPGERFAAAPWLDDLARHVAAAVHTARLAGDLQRSRERLVTAREEERRRLRRDLHDGLGPTLAGVALGLEAAQNTLDRDPGTVQRLLGSLRADTQAAIADIRRLVYELRPPVLDLGLDVALHEQAANLVSRSRGREAGALLVTVDAPSELTGLPAAVEVAAYRIAMEALHNAARHSGARSCCVRLHLNGGLELEVTDDGIGLPDGYRAGVGLQSMRERAAELGGTCTVQRVPAGGTKVHAHLPLGDPTP